MKRMILAFVLVMFSSCVVHAESSNKDKSNHSKKEDKRANKKEKKDDDVVYLDMSTPDEDENSMPAITPKGKL